MEKIIEATQIRKVFPGVVALDDISFDLKLGEVHVLIGENGAGKSTLIKILSGVYTPTSGTVTVDGKKYDKLNPTQALHLGISVIFQELSVVDKLSIAENLFVGKLPPKKLFGIIPVVDFKKIYAETKIALDKVGLKNISPTTLVSSLSISQKQQVEIAKALVANARVIIMDEPTSSLNQQEVEELFSVIRNLRNEGVGIIYISHKLRELPQIGNRITILKDGKTVSTCNIDEITPDEIVSRMVGREMMNTHYNKDKSQITEEIIFEAKNIQRKDKKVKDVSFQLRKGEILGFSGLVGAGRTELMNAIFGSEKMASGEVVLNGKVIQGASPYHSLKNGLGMITENRRETGFMHNFEIWQNIAIPKALKYSKASGMWGLLNKKKEHSLAVSYSKDINVRCTSVNQMTTDLSGGNQQKVIIAKWLAAESELLIFDEPTRGIDVGAKNEIYRIMRELATGGKGILMISSELPELLSVCDRILVVNEGSITAEFSAEEATEEKIILAATQGV